MRRKLLHRIVVLTCFGIALCWHHTAFGQATSSKAKGTAPLWTVLTFDPKGDARDATAGDAALLAYRYDKVADVIWFRITVYGGPNPQAFGINLAFDTGGDDATKVNWWGANKAFKFDRLVTAWVTRFAHGYRGTIGVADAAGVNGKQFANVAQNLELRTEGDAILIGVKRADISANAKLSLIASIAANRQPNDELPNAGSVAIDLNAERPKQGLREVDFTRNNFELPKTYKTLSDARAPQIVKRGRGTDTLILIPGMYSGAHSFDQFLSRNESRYTMYVVTPPGLNGTVPRAEPANGLRLGDMPWTRLLERDLLNLIHEKKLKKPVIVAERQPGSIAAVELALQHPDEIGGVILVATNLIQYFPAPKDPARRTPIASADRVRYVEDTWATLWFKYVTADTWKSGDLPASLLTADPAKSESAWNDLESATLEVKIRYLCEFWASDVTAELDKLQVPILSLIPTFDEKFLADPANSFAKNSIVGSWDTLIPKHAKITLVRIPDARLFLLDDQPTKADEAVAAFVQQIKR